VQRRPQEPEESRESTLSFLHAPALFFDGRCRQKMQERTRDVTGRLTSTARWTGFVSRRVDGTLREHGTRGSISARETAPSQSPSRAREEAGYTYDPHDVGQGAWHRQRHFGTEIIVGIGFTLSSAPDSLTVAARLSTYEGRDRPMSIGGIAFRHSGRGDLDLAGTAGMSLRAPKFPGKSPGFLVFWGAIEC